MQDILPPPEVREASLWLIVIVTLALTVYAINQIAGILEYLASKADDDDSESSSD